MCFDPMVVEKKDEFLTVEAPLLHLVEDPYEGKGKVQSAFFRICPVEEIFKASLSTNGNESTSNFFGQSVIVVMTSPISVPSSANLNTSLFRLPLIARIYRNFLKWLVAKPVLPKDLVKKLLFGSLRYSFIVRAKSKSTLERFDLNHTEGTNEP